MSYTFKNTEINNEKASTFETKSLLYLIGQRKDSKDILYVTFDCFNDVSGINKNHDKIWDIQSKNEANINPKKIGKYLYTLFDNSTSIFEFIELIFFCPKLKDEYKIDTSKNIYNLTNIEVKTLARIENGLSEEVTRVRGLEDDFSKEKKSFFSKVLFVEDNLSENEYIKAITKFKNVDLKNEIFYTALFSELRNIQTAKKNSYIENETIAEIIDVLNFQRHLSSKDIELLIISRIIGTELFVSLSIPLYFSPVTDKLSIEDKKDLLQECNSNLSRAFFNKNSNKIFWQICERIIEYVEISGNKDVQDIYKLLFNDYEFKLSYLTENTVLYLISIIIQGINHDN